MEGGQERQSRYVLSSLGVRTGLMETGVGNLGSVEELLFAHTDMLAAPVILALKLVVKDNVKTVGVAFADTSLREMGVSEFVDNDLFSNTEVSRPSSSIRGMGADDMVLQALLIQLGVKEVLLMTDEKGTDYDLNKVRSLVERCNIVITDRKRGQSIVFECV